MGLVSWGRFDARDSLLRLLTEEGRGMLGKPEYAIAGSYTEFMRWRAEDRHARGYVTFLNTPERAQGREPGVLHRIGAWEEFAGEGSRSDQAGPAGRGGSVAVSTRPL